MNLKTSISPSPTQHISALLFLRLEQKPLSSAKKMSQTMEPRRQVQPWILRQRKNHLPQDIVLNIQVRLQTLGLLKH